MDVKCTLLLKTMNTMRFNVITHIWSLEEILRCVLMGFEDFFNVISVFGRSVDESFEYVITSDNILSYYWYLKNLIKLFEML